MNLLSKLDNLGVRAELCCSNAKVLSIVFWGFLFFFGGVMELLLKIFT